MAKRSNNDKRNRKQWPKDQIMIKENRKQRPKDKIMIT
jgi:hypothetical protein